MARGVGRIPNGFCLVMTTPDITRLIGVYNANGGVLGELRYAVGKLTGRAHCGLCDVTHRGVSPRNDWRELAGRFSVPITLLHLNERTEEIRQATEGGTPCVLGEIGGHLVALMGPADLDACRGDVGVFESRLGEAVAAVGEGPS